MRSIRIVGLCLVAVLAVSAVAAASAMAEAPEIGRCVKVAAGTGHFTTNECSKEAKPTKLGEWEFEAGAISKHFTGKSTGEASLETKGKVKVTCKEETSSGEFTSATEVGGVQVTFTGCTSNGFECESSGAGKGVVKTNTLAGMIVWEKKPKKVAIDLFAQPPSTLLAEFTCGPAKAEVKGSVLAPIPADKMETSVEQKFSAKKGVQKPKEYEAGGKKIPAFLESKIGTGEGAKFEEAGQTVTNLQTDEEALEVNTLR